MLQKKKKYYKKPTGDTVKCLGIIKDRNNELNIPAKTKSEIVGTDKGKLDG